MIKTYPWLLCVLLFLLFVGSALSDGCLLLAALLLPVVLLLLRTYSYTVVQ